MLIVLKRVVGMVKQPVSETSAFTMSSEDFPALPGTTSAAPAGSSNDTGSQAQPTSTSQPMESSSSDASRVNNQSGDTQQKRGIVTSPDGMSSLLIMWIFTSYVTKEIYVNIPFRESHKYSSKYGERPIWNGGTFDVYTCS